MRWIKKQNWTWWKASKIPSKIKKISISEAVVLKGWINLDLVTAATSNDKC